MLKTSEIGFLVAIFFLFSVNNSLAGAFPDTGQTKCYDYSVEITCPQPGEPFFGQDAQYAGAGRSYTKLRQNGVPLPDTATQADGWIMTRDNLTGLIWEVKTDDGSIHDKDNTYTWYDSNPATNGGHAGFPGDGTDTEDFINALNTANFGGYSDWRLPTVKELSSLVNSDISTPGPTIDTAWFPGTTPDDWSPYGSSTTHAVHPSNAWSLYYHVGTVTLNYKALTRYVRAVRGAWEEPPVLVDNGDGTVTDSATRLMWQKSSAPGRYTWQEALEYCENLTLAGHSDWRLPGRNELQSVLDYSRHNPAVDPILALEAEEYWSSTTYVSETDHAWRAFFENGDVRPGWGNTSKHASQYVLAVRGEQSGFRVIDGDINMNGYIDLMDAVLSAQIASGMTPIQVAVKALDVNGDNRIGTEELIFCLESAAGLR